MTHSPFYLADYFKVELDALGPDRFARWLKDSFHSEAPAPIPPHFQTSELAEETFGEVYETAVRELDEARKQIVANAVEAALADFPQSGKYEGLFSLALLGDALDLVSLGELLAGVFRRVLPPGKLQLKLPVTPIEAYSLREVLECGFRMTLSNQPRAARLSEWAYLFMTQIKDVPPEIKPALAPLYVLARRGLFEKKFSDARQKNFLAALEAVLRAGFYIANDPFPEFFEISIDGERYPADIDDILRTADAWIKGPQVRMHSRLADRFQGNPAGKSRITGSHTSGSIYEARFEREREPAYG